MYPCTIGELSPDISALGAANTVTFGSAPALGTSPNFLQSDAVLQFPASLQSVANSSQLTLTDDGANQTLTGSLGSVTLIPATSGQVILDSNTTTPAATTCLVRIRPSIANLTGISSAVLSGNFSTTASQTVAAWDSQMSLGSKIGDSAGGFNGTVIGYRGSVMSLGPTAGSGTANVAHYLDLASPNVTTTNGSWAEIATVNLGGPKRGISNPTVTLAATQIMECPTISATDQMGIYVKQRTAQQVATNRYGMKVDSHTSGTNRWSMWGSNKIHCDASDFIANASGFGFCNRDSQSSSAGGGGTARYWRSFVDASATGVAGDVTFAIDSTGVLTVTRAGGATGTVLFTLKDVGTAAVTT